MMEGSGVLALIATVSAFKTRLGVVFANTKWDFFFQP